MFFSTFLSSSFFFFQEAIQQEVDAEYTFANTEWGDEEFMEEHAHQLQEDREKKRLQRHVKRHADEHVHEIQESMKDSAEQQNQNQDDDEDEEGSEESESDAEIDERDEDSISEFHSEFGSMDDSLMTKLGGLEVHDGERVMEKDAIYVFSGGLTTIRKFRIGASDQEEVDGKTLKSPHRSFFSDERPRLKNRGLSRFLGYR